MSWTKICGYDIEGNYFGCHSWSKRDPNCYKRITHLDVVEITQKDYYSICVSCVHHSNWWCFKGMQKMYQDTCVCFLMVTQLRWWTASNMIDFITCSDVDSFLSRELFCDLSGQIWEQFFLIFGVCQKIGPVTWDFCRTRYSLTSTNSSFFPCNSFNCQWMVSVPYNIYPCRSLQVMVNSWTENLYEIGIKVFVMYSCTRQGVDQCSTINKNIRT